MISYPRLLWCCGGSEIAKFLVVCCWTARCVHVSPAVHAELIEGVTNKDLWEKSTRRKGKKRAYRSVKKAHIPRTSIEKRPIEIEERKEFGHWEIDLVVGGKGTSSATLLTLTERLSRIVIIRKLPDKTQASVFVVTVKYLQKGYGLAHCPYHFFRNPKKRIRWKSKPAEKNRTVCSTP